jgi:hypothetical protein
MGRISDLYKRVFNFLLKHLTSRDGVELYKALHFIIFRSFNVCFPRHASLKDYAHIFLSADHGISWLNGISQFLITCILFMNIAATLLSVDTIGFWRWCITHRDIGFSNFVHRPDFSKITMKNTTFRKLDQWLRLALSKGPNRVGVFPHLRTETDPVSEMLCFSLLFRKSPVIEVSSF